MNLMITTNQKPVADTQRRERDSNMTLNSHEVTRKEAKEADAKRTVEAMEDN